MDIKKTTSIGTYRFYLYFIFYIIFRTFSSFYNSENIYRSRNAFKFRDYLQDDIIFEILILHFFFIRDGDIIIDGTLFDFKSEKNVGFKWQEVAQLLGYFLLNEIPLDVSNAGDIYFTDHSYHHLEINRIAFYRARYGEIEYIDLSF